MTVFILKNVIIIHGVFYEYTYDIFLCNFNAKLWDFFPYIICINISLINFDCIITA